ncbi:MAG: TrkH family potassium uptake protein [Treponema sp.]|nr:TrkH family potassium uptake protein [Candidatus Treponema equi]
MKYKSNVTFTVIKVLFLIIAIVGLSFSIPVATAVYCGEYDVLPSFLLPMTISSVLGILFLFLKNKQKAKLTVRASFVVVAVAWIGASLFGAVPLYASGAIPNIIDAVFESVSGFTTTGATILSEIETLPRSINMWRCLTHWLGGMGIVALTVALLPILGIGGFQLIKAETTGPEKGKFTPRITTTAKILWFIYLGMTLLEALLLKLAGMDFIDALSHAFSTLGTGGFSTRNASIASYNSAAIDWICFTFMFLSGINFSLYFYIFARQFSELKNNSELKAYLALNIVAILIMTILEKGQFGGFFNSLRFSSFQVATISSTTGFATSDFTLWSPASQAIVFMLLFIGGSSGSTSGGVKVVRWVLFYKVFKNEIQKLIHPHGIFSVRLNQQNARKDVLTTVAAFFAMFFILLIATTFYGTLFGMDLLTSFTGAASMIGNVGPGFGALGPACNYGWLAAPVKWFYCFVMLAGRLELFTMFVFLSPSFWKK